MISVVIVTYNRAALLAKCVNSVLNQTYKELEIFVIDDGSTDNTKEVVNNISDKRVIYIYKEKKNKSAPGNISALRNIAILASKGEYIAFCDDDDMWMENKLEVLLPYMKTEKIVCSNAKVVDYQGNVLFQKITNFDDDRYIDLAQLLEDNRVVNSCVLVRREVLFEAGLFDEEHGNRSEDWCVWLKIAEKHDIKYVNKELVCYRVHGDNLSRKSFEDKKELTLRNIEIVLPYLKYKDAKTIVGARKGLSLLYSQLSKLYYENGYYKDSSKACKKFLLFYQNKLSAKFFKYLLFFFYLLFLSFIKKSK